MRVFNLFNHHTLCSGGFRGGAPPSLRPKIFPISCSFSQNLAKSYVSAPLEGWRPLLRGNPGSTPACGQTDTCKNNLLISKLRLRAVINHFRSTLNLSQFRHILKIFAVKMEPKKYFNRSRVVPVLRVTFLLRSYTIVPVLHSFHFRLLDHFKG